MKVVILLLLGSLFALAQDPRNVTGVYHPIGYLFNDGGAVLQIGEVGFYSPGISCRVFNWRGTVIGTSSPSVTIDVWKLTGAYPTVTNTITSTTTPVISGTTPVSSTNVGAWSKNVLSTDTFAFNIKTLSGSPTQASLVLGCK
jgi:hypothetical protein